MIIFVYDNSFEGLLTAIYEAYYTDIKPRAIVSDEYYEPNLIDNRIYIESDITKSNKVYEAIKKKISQDALRHVYHVFLSELKEAPTVIYKYLLIAFRMGYQVDFLLTNQHVLNMHKISKKVSREKHRMLGLTRFQLIKEDFYYAPIEPDYHIIGLLAPHFANRMADQHWMIHDVKRGAAAVYDKKEWFLTEVDMKLQASVGAEEELYQELWKTYFKSISISERRNPKLQKNFMPTRYWKFLTEKKQS
ncbi:TIGR03915 family putative DNA repair protein [Alkaliphilus peptidifermentans]|uniref:Probable DNA metabolism protein n=1 Tax=Alkaliphilus peptidifermentans DSM 18978 TaxID=1120976 RepID=A0A1G5ACF1_9FIRM|nr:TIGR03915 family putative DNA repair protein [Alkaliphilus peptidifermentans]SCX75590.1 probable DNA metabolism protein [Alkaliphilus peptidifermentans DSM 18978]